MSISVVPVFAFMIFAAMGSAEVTAVIECKRLLRRTNGNDRIVVEADLEFRPESETIGIVRCTVDFQSQVPDSQKVKWLSAIADRRPGPKNRPPSTPISRCA
jgi:hypothetical protein